MYDPTLGRFLSADPYIQYPDSTQGLNRYSYVDNNPLSLTDPSGLFLGKIFKSIGKAFSSLFKAVGSLFKNPYVRLAIGVAAGFYGGQAIALRALGAAAKGGLAFNVVAGASGGFIAGAIIGGNLESGFYGAISGGMAGGIGYYGAALGNWKLAAQGLAGGITQRIQGGSFQSGLLSGAFASWGQGSVVGKITSGSDFLEFAGRSVASAVIGGTASAIGGGKFANGAQTGAFAYTFGSVARDMQNGASFGDAIGKLWSLPTSVVGLAYGGVGYGLGWIRYGLGLQALPPDIAFGNNAIQFINNPLTATATTFGNVIVYNPDPVYHPSSTFTNSGMPLGFEEMQHTFQGQVLGPLYLPAHGLLGAGALLFNGNWHGPFNVLETGPHSTPPRPWP